MLYNYSILIGARTAEFSFEVRRKEKLTETIGIVLLTLSAAIVVTGGAIAQFKTNNRALWVGISYVLASLLVASSIFCFATNSYKVNGEITARAIVGHFLVGIAFLSLYAGVGMAFYKNRHKLWWFAGFMLGTVIVALVAINVAYPYAYDGDQELSSFAMMARIISSVFQSFSLDAGYIDMVVAGETAFAGGSFAVCVLLVLITVVAPATGGFAVFGMLCHFFPYLKMLTSGIFNRTRYVFSELNEYSIETAESIVRKKNENKANGRSAHGRFNEDDKWLRRSAIIFTDAYSDADSEKSSELQDRAKNLGAICIKDDITECKFHWAFGRNNKKIVYFLMDKDEESNLKVATTLLAVDRPALRNAEYVELYVFTQNEYANGVINRAYKTLENHPDRKKCEIGFKTINEYKNLIYQLIDGNEDEADTGSVRKSYPLYWNLVNGKNSDFSSLSVAVVGGGKIAREFIKAAYWCGQMLKSTEHVFPSSDKKQKIDKNAEKFADMPFEPTALSITVISDNATEVERSLRFEMPEVFSDDVKKYNYCKFEFIDAVYGTAGDKGFSEMFRQKCCDADYVLVALGDDERNMKAAHWIRLEIDRKHIGKPMCVPVNYAIENEDLCESLIANDTDASNGSCILNPFGSLSRRYDFDNIYMSALEQRAWIADRTHNDGKSKTQFMREGYSLNSSIASVLHYSYKRAVFRKIGNIDNPDYISDYAPQIYWLEHRRWCSYIRSLGMRCPTADEYLAYAFDANGAFDGGNVDRIKDDLKLHACLLESGAYLPEQNEIETYHEKYRDEITKSVSSCKKTPQSRSLCDWLYSFDALAGVPERFDALDRLGIVVNIDYKKADINIVNSLYKDELCREITNYLYSAKDAECKDKVKRLVDTFVPYEDFADAERISCDGYRMIRVGRVDKSDVIAAFVPKEACKTEICGLKVAEKLDRKFPSGGCAYLYDTGYVIFAVSGTPIKIGDKEITVVFDENAERALKITERQQ